MYFIVSNSQTALVCMLILWFAFVKLKKLLTYLLTYLYLDNSQFGCRKSRSTTHALIAIVHTWMTCLDSHGSVRSVFVDFLKAFDLVDHNVLLVNCLSTIYMYQIFQIASSSYLSNRQQRVGANTSLSSFRLLKGAMPQGS